MMTGNQLQWSTVPHRLLSANKVLIFLGTTWHKEPCCFQKTFVACQATSASSGNDRCTYGEVQKMSYIVSDCLQALLQCAQCSHCKRCISYSNSARLSVRPSVTRQYCVSALSDSKNVSSFVETKKYSAGTTLPPEMLPQSDPP